MTHNDKPLHKLLLKQLERSELDVEKIKSLQPSQWEDFLFWLSNAYYGYEQERYLLERSMDIAMREHKDLTERLKDAHEIAHMGYFYTDRATKIVSWSPEMFRLSGIDPSEGAPPMEKLLSFVHEDEREQLRKNLERAFYEGMPYEMELRWKNKKTGVYAWAYVKASCFLNKSEDSGAPKVKALSGIVMDISDRKKNEEVEKKKNEQLLFLSRRAGMAEIATSVLHNIGNVLNSTTVSVSLLKEILERPLHEKLVKIYDLLKSHKENLQQYLTEDERGKVIPGYLVDLLPMIEEARTEAKREVFNLMESVSHIKDIVLSQNALSGSSGVMEKIVFEDLMTTAVQMTNHEKTPEQIELKKNFQKTPAIYSDKSKVLQICVNLIQNAKDAVLQKPEGESKVVELSIMTENNQLIFRVKDNGTGVAPEDAKNIFSFGFTTKKNGHGFGLHSSILAAQELGGSLTFESPGLNQGTTFIFSLPITLKTD